MKIYISVTAFNSRIGILKLALTGSSGFIGLNFVNISKSYYSELFLIKRDELLTFDYCGVDVVVHLAAIAHAKEIKPDKCLRVNRDLPVQIAQKAKKEGVKHFIFLSSIKVYGNDTGSKVLTLTDTPTPDDIYGRSKLDAEMELQKLADKEFTVSIIRTPLVYGPAVKANMLGLLKAVKGFPILPFGSVGNRRSIVFTGNLVAFINRIIERRLGGTFLVSDGEPISTSSLISTIANRMERRIYLLPVPNFILRVASLVAPSVIKKLWGNCEVDSSDSFRLAGFVPPYTLDEGVDEMVRWFRRL